VGAEDKAMQSNNLVALSVEEIESILGVEPELTFNQNLATELLADEAIEILEITTRRINARLAQGILLSDASNKWDRIARGRARRVDINVF
jgi:hypothetical protein